MIDFLNRISRGEYVSISDTCPQYLEYGAPEFNRKEMLRYAGIMKSYSNLQSGEGEEESGELSELFENTLEKVKSEFKYCVSYRCCSLGWDAEGFPALPFEQHSENLKNNLTGCKAIVIFTATVGAGIDRMIRRYERVEPARALFMQGIGAERVEAVCDTFNAWVKACASEAGLCTNARYSPGYGDLPITVQPYVLELTDAGRSLGITLNASYLMSPSKSVTAIIGIK